MRRFVQSHSRAMAALAGTTGLPIAAAPAACNGLSSSTGAIGSSDAIYAPYASSSSAAALPLRMAARFQGGGGAISKAQVWNLWNEGNLFSLTVQDLTAFLAENGKTVDPKMKKSALVREVEDMMSKEQPAGANSAVDGDTVSSVTAEATSYDASGAELAEESDVYGDWGAEPGFEDKKQLDFMELSPSRMQQDYDPLSPRAFQLLHEEASSDMALVGFNPSKLPGQRDVKEAFTVTPVVPDSANRIRFRRALKWAITNLWNLNMPGELNIGAGKALYWRHIAKHNRNILPVWTCQQHLYNTHPYTWFAVASDSNADDVASLAAKLGMTQIQEPVTSYKIAIKRSRDQLDCELNANLQCTLLMSPWDRFLVSHVLRTNMPDLRYMVRARHPPKKRLADLYMNTQIIRLTKESVTPVLSPDLGEVSYCCERVIRKWGVKLGGGVTLQLVETKRTPLVVSREGEEGMRTEYEFIVNVPNKVDGVDLTTFADEMWSYGNEFAGVLENGMQELQAHVMPSSAAFDPIAA